MKIGIDKISIDVSNKYISIEELAIKRKVEIEKFTKGIGQIQMSITGKNQDIVSMALNATKSILDEDDKLKIDLIILATESSIDESKASSIYIKEYLGINSFSKCIEIKQACFGATAALDYAKAHIILKPNSKVLVIASDIAKYGVNSGGEVTQGSGSIAMLISKDPRILEFNFDEVSYSTDVMDFWRPTYSKYPYVDGKFSIGKYLELLSVVWEKFENKEDLSAICLHTPYTKLAKKGLFSITNDESILSKFEDSIMYNKRVGNIYTGSVYLSLVSLLSNNINLKSGDNIGIYSYGSGAVAQFFSLKLVEGYKKYINKEYFDNLLDSRKKLNIDEYEKTFFEDIKLDEEGSCIFDKENVTYIKEIKNHKRMYEMV